MNVYTVERSGDIAYVWRVGTTEICSNDIQAAVDIDGEDVTEVELETKAGSEWDKGDCLETFWHVCSMTNVPVLYTRNLITEIHVLFSFHVE